jgi:hypothetical protein
MAILDIFRSDAFGLTSLTQSLLKLPYKPSRIGEMGIFQDKGIPTLTATIEEKDGVLSLLTSGTRGSQAKVASQQKRKARTFQIPYFPYDREILASDVQGVRAFGSENEVETVAAKVNEFMGEMRQSHEVTLEYLRLGALHGQILDGDASTIIYNLFQEFGLGRVGTTSAPGGGSSLPDGFTYGYNSATSSYTDLARASLEFGAGQQYLDIVGLSGQGNTWSACPSNLSSNLGQHVYTFLFSDPTFIVRQVCMAIARDIEKTLGMSTYDHIHAFCGSNFFDKLIDHDDVRATYLNWFQATNLRQDLRKGFEYGGIVWENYRGSVSGHQFQDPDQCIIFPVGSPGLFQTYYAPADFIETVNTIGLPMYAKQEPLPFNKGIQLHTQSNPLPLCTRPLSLVTGVIG